MESIVVRHAGRRYITVDLRFGWVLWRHWHVSIFSIMGRLWSLAAKDNEAANQQNVTNKIRWPGEEDSVGLKYGAYPYIVNKLPNKYLNNLIMSTKFLSHEPITW